MNNSEKYSVVILNHHASSPDVGGGGRHYELAKHLSEMGHRVTVIASSYDNWKKKYYFSQETIVKEYDDKFRFIWLKTKPAYKNNLFRFVNYFDYMLKASKFNKFKESPNVVIASSVHPLAWVAGYKLSKKYNAKFIVEVRDLWPLSLYEDLKGIYRKAVFSFFELLEKKYYNLADNIVTTMPYAYEYMEKKYGISKTKVKYIPHGIDIDEFDKNMRKNEEELNLQLRNVLDNYFCITYTGALSKSEGLPTLVESAKHLEKFENIRIVIIGSGPEKEKLENIIEKENLKNVIMFEKQRKDLIPLILSKSNILFCGLMEREAFKYGISKNKFYDYMAAKKPIIFASSVKDSLIDKAGAGITIKPGDPVKLSDAIVFLYNNMDTIGKEYAENGRQYVEKYHTNQKIADDFMQVILS